MAPDASAAATRPAAGAEASATMLGRSTRWSTQPSATSTTTRPADPPASHMEPPRCTRERIGPVEMTVGGSICRELACTTDTPARPATTTCWRHAIVSSASGDGAATPTCPAHVTTPVGARPATTTPRRPSTTATRSGDIHAQAMGSGPTGAVSRSAPVIEARPSAPSAIMRSVDDHSIASTVSSRCWRSTGSIPVSKLTMPPSPRSRLRVLLRRVRHRTRRARSQLSVGGRVRSRSG